jgi:dihydrolipoamide dehydrogenase
MRKQEYDVVILGAGPGGYTAAIRGAQLGLKVAIVEKEQIGGVCLNYGCIPTKYLTKNAEIIRDIRNASKRGINVSNYEIDVDTMMSDRKKVTHHLSKGVTAILKSNGVSIFIGEGQVTEENTLKITTYEGISQYLVYTNLIIATGLKAKIPEELKIYNKPVMTYKDLLNLKKIPKSITILGGGVIGCEFATICNELGSKVTLIQRSRYLLSKLDKDISRTITSSMKRNGINVLTEQTVKKIEETDHHVFILTLENGEKIEADEILHTYLSESNMEGLELLDLETDNGYIRINDYFETSYKNVYAIGDVTGKTQLAHVASDMGIKVIENFVKQRKAMTYNCIPSSIFTYPEIGTVGLTEEEAKKKYKNIKIGRFPLSANGKAQAIGEPEGFAKVIVDDTYDEIVGIHIVGYSAGELAAYAATFIGLEATIDELIDLVHPHPTISETILEAGLDVRGMAVHMPPIPK